MERNFETEASQSGKLKKIDLSDKLMWTFQVQTERQKPATDAINVFGLTLEWQQRLLNFVLDYF